MREGDRGGVLATLRDGRQFRVLLLLPWLRLGHLHLVLMMRFDL